MEQLKFIVISLNYADAVFINAFYKHLCCEAIFSQYSVISLSYVKFSHYLQRFLNAFMNKLKKIIYSFTAMDTPSHDKISC